MSVKPIPNGFHTVTPYLLVSGVDKLLEFLRNAFDADVTVCTKMRDGEITHAQVKIGDSMVMMGDLRGTRPSEPASLYVYVPDCDAMHKKAVAAGGTPVMEPTDMFYGDRHSGVKDPTGNTWWIATHIEDMSSEELNRRAEQHGQA